MSLETSDAIDTGINLAKDFAVLGDKTANINMDESMMNGEITKVLGSISKTAELTVGIGDLKFNEKLNLGNNAEEGMKSLINLLNKTLEENDYSKSGKTDFTVLKIWVQENTKNLKFLTNINIEENETNISGNEMKEGKVTVDNKALDTMKKLLGTSKSINFVPRSTNTGKDVKIEERKSDYSETEKNIPKESRAENVLFKLNDAIRNSKLEDKANLWLRAHRVLVYVAALVNDGVDEPKSVTFNLESGENADTPGIHAITTPSEVKKVNIGAAGLGLKQIADNMPPNGQVFAIKEGEKTYYGEMIYYLNPDNNQLEPRLEIEYTSKTTAPENKKITIITGIGMGMTYDEQAKAAVEIYKSVNT